MKGWLCPFCGYTVFKNQGSWWWAHCRRCHRDFAPLDVPECGYRLRVVPDSLLTGRY